MPPGRAVSASHTVSQITVSGLTSYQALLDAKPIISNPPLNQLVTVLVNGRHTVLREVVVVHT